MKTYGVIIFQSLSKAHHQRKRLKEENKSKQYMKSNNRDIEVSWQQDEYSPFMYFWRKSSTCSQRWGRYIIMEKIRPLFRSSWILVVELIYGKLFSWRSRAALNMYMRHYSQRQVSQICLLKLKLWVLSVLTIKYTRKSSFRNLA